jgi:hypothetical protein
MNRWYDFGVDLISDSLNKIDCDILAEEKKKADADKKANDLETRILSIRKTISKNTTQSQLASKEKQIEGYQRDYNRKKTESDNHAGKIAQLKEKRIRADKRLQKAEEEERKDQATSVKKLQQSYENRIRALTALQTPVIEPVTATSADAEHNSDCHTLEYDVFISHAWEDKGDFVEDLVAELEKLGIKPWYDKQRITWGDSMRTRIDRGLAGSKFGIAVISPNYIADGKYWTKAELDGLFQLESVNGKTILPIWHNITKKDVIAYSPIIASKLAMTTSTMTPAEIAAEMKKLIEQTGSED